MLIKTQKDTQAPSLEETADAAIKGGDNGSPQSEAYSPGGSHSETDASGAYSPGGSHSETKEGANNGDKPNSSVTEPSGTNQDGKHEEVDPYNGGLEGIDSQIKTVDDWMARLKAPESKEEREKRERKEKSRRVISAVSDGLSALGNLFFTTRYAPSMYDAKTSMTGATNALIEKARAEREKNDEAYYNYALKRGELQNARAKTLREIEAEKKRQEIAAQKAKDDHDKAEFDKTLRPFMTKEAEGKATKAQNEATRAGHEAERARVIAEYAPKQEEATYNKTNAQTAAAKASANASNASAENSRASAGEHRARTNKINREAAGQPYAYDGNGKKHYFDKWETAERYAREHGTWEEYDIETVTDSELNGKTTNTKKGGYSKQPVKKKKSPTR